MDRKMRNNQAFTKGKGWRHTDAYNRILELMDEYWLDNPTESYVNFDMTFIDKYGRRRTARVYWENPRSEGTEKKAMDIRRKTLDRTWDMPAAIGSWTGEEKTLFYKELAKMKAKFYDYVTEKILTERQKREK